MNFKDWLVFVIWVHNYNQWLSIGEVMSRELYRLRADTREKGDAR